MGIVLKEEHLLAYVSTIMSSELRRHCRGGLAQDVPFFYTPYNLNELQSYNSII